MDVEEGATDADTLKRDASGTPDSLSASAAISFAERPNAIESDGAWAARSEGGALVCRPGSS